MHALLAKILQPGQTLVSFLDFQSLLVAVANDPCNTLDPNDSPDVRLNVVLQTMDKSNGRSKIGRLSRCSTVLPSFSLLSEHDVKHPPSKGVGKGANGAFHVTEDAHSADTAAESGANIKKKKSKIPLLSQRWSALATGVANKRPFT